MEEPKTKVCSKCGRELPIERFTRNHTCRNGYAGQCKDCKREYMRKYNARKGQKLPPSCGNPKFDGKTPRELQQEMRELKAELIARGFNVTVKCTILQEIII